MIININIINYTYGTKEIKIKKDIRGEDSPKPAFRRGGPDCHMVFLKRRIS
jgi:hypothetical protein